jgi:gas vesicle protein
LKEKEALALVFANTKGKKKRNTNILSIATALNELKEVYGSSNKVAEKVGLSGQMVREFLSVLDLPQNIKNLIEQRKIDSVDKIKRIKSLISSGKDIMNESVLIEVERISTEDFRDVERLVKHGNVGVKEALKVVSNGKRKNEHLLILTISEKEFSILKKLAEERGLSEADYALEMLRTKLSAGAMSN